MRIALLHNPRPDEAATQGCLGADDAFEEDDAPETIASIMAALGQAGWTVGPVVADRRLPWRLEEGRFDFAFNIAEGRGRRCREAVPAAVCELLGLPFTGSDALTLAVTLDKATARRIVGSEVPVAPAVLIENGHLVDGNLDALRFPVIVKPNDEGSSKGIRESPCPLASDSAAALRQSRWLFATYGCPVLVEEFLPGTEVTIGLAGNADAVRLLGMMAVEPAVPNGPFVYSVDVKRDWPRRVRYSVPPRLPAQTLANLEAAARSAWRLLGCRDLARIDFRLDAAGRPHFLECNPLPGLHPVDSDIVLLTQTNLPYEDLVQGVVRDAARRLAFPLP
jgi:D-alanine-D-alanine ligase